MPASITMEQAARMIGLNHLFSLIEARQRPLGHLDRRSLRDIASQGV